MRWCERGGNPATLKTQYSAGQGQQMTAVGTKLREVGQEGKLVQRVREVRHAISATNEIHLSVFCFV